MSESDHIRHVLIRLHQRKSADYGNAWKKRGEVLSILANIARKVDRLEVLAGKQAAQADESLVDTLVDLLVYCVKYQTYLADSDATVAGRLALPDTARPFSDGVAGFEHALSRVSLVVGDPRNPLAIEDVISAFERLESCFSEVRPTSSPVERLDATSRLIDLTVEALGHIANVQPAAWRQFILSHI
jgi:hypothetical protein